MLDPAPSWEEEVASSVLVEGADPDPDPVLAVEDVPVLAGGALAMLSGGGEPVLAGVRIHYWLGGLELGCQEMIQFWLVTVFLSLLGQVVLLAGLGPMLFVLELVVLLCC